MSNLKDFLKASITPPFNNPSGSNVINVENQSKDMAESIRDGLLRMLDDADDVILGTNGIGEYISKEELIKAIKEM